MTLLQFGIYILGVAVVGHFFLNKFFRDLFFFTPFLMRPFSNIDNFWLLVGTKSFIIWFWPIGLVAWTITATLYYFIVTS